MGTSNYYKINASKIFAICESYVQSKYDEEGNETGETEVYSPDEWEYNENLNNINERLIEKLKDFNFIEKNVISQHENRNFPSRYIGTFYKTATFGDINVDVEINCYSRSGYYDGACLDWELNICLDNNECDSTDSVFETFVYNCCSFTMNKGMLVIQGKNCDKWVNKTKDTMIELIESVYEECSTPLKVVSRASNGETIYERS